MLVLIAESGMMGLVVCIVGTIIFNLSINKLNNTAINKPYGIEIAFFITGILLHLISYKLSSLIES
jgi:hypothetical protein